MIQKIKSNYNDHVPGTTINVSFLTIATPSISFLKK